MQPQLAYTVDQACEALAMNRSRIYKAIADGSIKTFKTGRRRMVSAKALEEYVAKLEREAEKGRAAA
ncbi:excisionase family DNA binding protein [Dokdonella fugitiva]|uniref:Excisionase family DNA binding protein n=1 Tax=Dokdonella fugitiva TaxID=328517 RepID=A0A839F1N7_9GAMM|nr:helix-turn-helix domain-containing protein [Dokdonella fugitiva]MBA8888893.1 excisionase family DNA binding protein [Dokdonella fugitiva]